MTTIHHETHPDDGAAMLAMRAMIALAGDDPLAPEARLGFDAMIAGTPAVFGVTHEAAAVGGAPG